MRKPEHRIEAHINQISTARENRKLRILSLALSYPNLREPGAGIFIQGRLRAMAAQAEVRVVAPVSPVRFSRGLRFWSGAGNIPLIEEGEPKVYHPRWIYPPLAGAWNASFLAFWLRPLIVRLGREFRPDLLDAQYGTPEGPAAEYLARRLNLPYAVTLRGSETIHVRGAARRRQLARTLRAAAAVVTVSSRLRDFALSLGASPEKTRTISNGVDGEIFHPRPREACRNLHQLPVDAYVVLSAGNLVELKGHHRVIQAVAELRREGHPAFLVICGDAQHGAAYETHLHALVAKLAASPFVRFAGRMPQARLAEMMAAADVLCLASRSEGWPNVVHESLSCGTPVVAFDVGAVPDMILSPEYGLIVPAENQDALQKALRSAAGRGWNRDEIARWGRERSWERVAGEVLAFYRSRLPRY